MRVSSGVGRGSFRAWRCSCPSRRFCSCSIGSPSKHRPEPHCCSTTRLLAEHGLRLDSHIDPDQLAARCLHRSDGSLVAPPFGFTAIAHAFTRG